MRLPPLKPFPGCVALSLCLWGFALQTGLLAETEPASSPTPIPPLSSIVDRMVKRQESLAHELNAYQFLEQIEVDSLGFDNLPRKRSHFVIRVLPNSHALILTDVRGDEKARREMSEAEVKRARRGIETVYSLRRAVPRFRVVLLGHGDWHGEPAYHLGFSGKPDEPYRTPLEKILNQVHGEMHVSASDYSILETHAFLAQPVSVAWFLVRFERLAFSYVAQRIPLGYVPRTVVFHYRVRIPFASRHERQKIELVDYRLAKPTGNSPGP